MCSVVSFLSYLVEWLQDHGCRLELIERVVGLSKCLIGKGTRLPLLNWILVSDQIYKSGELRCKYVEGLMDLVASQSAQPNISLTRNLLHALCLCVKHKNDEATNRAFYKKHRFQHDLRKLRSKEDLGQESKDCIQELLQHVSFCSGLFKGRADNTPMQSPSYFNSSFAPGYSLSQFQRPRMPLTSLLNANTTSARGGNFYSNHQPPITPTSITMNSTSRDSSLPSSADSKTSARKQEDLKRFEGFENWDNIVFSSGYSEISMESDLFHQQYGQHGYSSQFTEYSEPKKQAFIRNLQTTNFQTTQQQWNSPTNSSAISSLYENHDVIVNRSRENFPA